MAGDFNGKQRSIVYSTNKKILYNFKSLSNYAIYNQID